MERAAFSKVPLDPVWPQTGGRVNLFRTGIRLVTELMWLSMEVVLD